MNIGTLSRVRFGTALRIPPGLQFALLLLLFLLPCFAESDPPVDEIHLATVNSNYRAALEKIATEYEELHPEIRVKISIVTNEFSAWLRTQFAGGELIAPDIYNGNYTSEYVQLGKWQPLNDYLKQVNPYTGKQWMDSLDKKFVERFYHGGIAYYIPIDFIDVAFVYNADIFAQLGLTAPETWSELIEVCQIIQEEGHTVEVRGETGRKIIPMAMSGNAVDFWEGPVGWFERILQDAYHRSDLALIMAQPGDWNYDPDPRRSGFNPDFSDRYGDNLTVINAERRLLAIKNGLLRVDSPKSRAVYAKMKEISQFWPKGYQGINFSQSQTLFLRQRAAILFTTSHFVSNSVRLWRWLDPEDRFEWAAFAPPRIEDDPLCEGPLRGIGNAGMNLVVTRKSNLDHVERVVDFMMFLTTPRCGQMFVDETLADDQFIVGPIQIQGVEMPEDLQAKYGPFLNRGFEKVILRNGTIQYEWTILTQELLGGRLNLDRYLQEFQIAWESSVPKEIERFGYDMDPSTKDIPEKIAPQKLRNFFNPLENGLLTVILMLSSLAGLMIYFLRQTHGMRRREAFLAYALILPTLALLILFLAFPALSGLYRAFSESNVEGQVKFIGLQNFSRLARDFFIYRGTANMAIIVLANVIKATTVPFLVAELLLAVSSNRLRQFFRTVFIVPVVVPTITLILIWGFVYDPNIGLLNSILRAVGMEGRSWLGEPNLALASIIGVGFPWVNPVGLLIYMAALVQISPSIRDAARLDCRNPFQRMIFVDVPLVQSQTKLLVILTLIMSIQDFQLILLMTNGGPGLATSVPALQMYQHAFKYGEFGYAASIGFALFVLILVVTLLNLKFIRTEKEIA